MEGFAQAGGIINFVVIDRNISFEINADAAKQSKLRISSKLLNLAEIIEDSQGLEEI